MDLRHAGQSGLVRDPARQRLLPDQQSAQWALPRRLQLRDHPGAEVRQWTCNGLAVQQWQVNAVTGGYSTLVNRHSGLCLDDYNWATTPGAEVRQWTCLNNNAQHWRIS
ncbi:RICIN domain-containing protein [Catellatospora coxensis]